MSNIFAADSSLASQQPPGAGNTNAAANAGDSGASWMPQAPSDAEMLERRQEIRRLLQQQRGNTTNANDLNGNNNNSYNNNYYNGHAANANANAANPNAFPPIPGQLPPLFTNNGAGNAGSNAPGAGHSTAAGGVGVGLVSAESGNVYLDDAAYLQNELLSNPIHLSLLAARGVFVPPDLLPPTVRHLATVAAAADSNAAEPVYVRSRTMAKTKSHQLSLPVFLLRICFINIFLTQNMCILL